MKVASLSTSELASDYLKTEADALVAEWIAWCRNRIQTSAVASLPIKALENHIPPVVQSLSRFVANPVEALRTELIGHLRMHGQIRRDQGYALEEVIAEFDGLATIITRRLQQVMLDNVDCVQLGEVLEVFARLGIGLRSISHVVMNTFNEFENEKRQLIARHLEEFARAVCHELRTPLSVIKMSSHAIRQDLEGNAHGLDHLEMIETAVTRNLAMLDTIRMLAIAEGAWAGDRRIALEVAIENVFREFADLSHEKGVVMTINGDIPDVKLESILAYIVLVNLIGNALKYADEQKQERWLKVSADTVPEENDSGFCEIKVEDNGIGIPEEQLPRILQKGFRAHPEVAFGTGMGLFIVQQTLIDRGGSVEIDSVEGDGTSVKVLARCLSIDSQKRIGDKLQTSAHLNNAICDDIRTDISESEGEEGDDDA